MNRLVGVLVVAVVIVLGCEHIPTANVRPTGTSPTRLVAGFMENVVADLDFDPTAMEFAPDGRLFVLSQAGAVRVIKNGALLPTPFLTLDVDPQGERGLLGIAFDPNFASNRFIYLYYSSDQTHFNRVSRFTANADNPDIGDPSSETILLDGMHGVNLIHNGGAIHFGLDGKLYIATGDGANPPSAQDLSVPEGKILRINPDGSIPSDNPFVGTAGARPEIWAYGLRNPFTFAVQPGTGVIHINDVGQDTWEEIDLGRAGANYGWPTCEGACSDPRFDNPIYQYDHSNGCAITGGTFAEGSAFPSMFNGAYFFGDLCAGFIRARLADGSIVDLGVAATKFNVDFKMGPDGTLFYLSRQWLSVQRVIPTGSTNHAPVAVADLNPDTGPAPLAVTVDASRSSDADGDSLTYSWDFGDGATGTGVSASHTFSQAGPFVITLTASDPSGASAVDTALVRVGTPPVGAISLPAEGAVYRAGDTISFAGSGSDAEDGTLGPGSFSWTILFHHDAHTHPFLGPITNTTSGSFVIPTVGETSPNVWYRLYLTLTDATGLQTLITRDVRPVTSTFTLATSPPGLGLTLDGQPLTAPSSITGVVGIRRALGAPAQQVVGGHTYNFVSWSDGGSATHDISTPEAGTTYTATYMEVSGGGTGDVDVTTTTTGSAIDPDGYVIVGDESVQRPIGDNATVRFSGVAAGDHTARLDGLAPNCAVSGPNPRTVNVSGSALTTVTFSVQCDSAASPPPPGGLRMSGSGSAGQVSLTIDVTDAPLGSLRVVDGSIIRPGGTAASAVMDPAVDAATGIVSLTKTSPACVTVAGRARVDNGDLVDITVDVCDNATSGAGADTFTISVPAYGYRAGGSLTSGDFLLASP